MTAVSSIDEPRMPPVSRRSVGTSSATWRRQKPCFRSRSARKPMSSTRSLMIASSVARSERARTAQIGQPPSRIASSRRTSTMRACRGSLAAAPSGGRSGADRAGSASGIGGTDRRCRPGRARTRRRRAAAARSRGARARSSGSTRVALGDRHLGASRSPSTAADVSSRLGQALAAPGGCDAEREQLASGGRAATRDDDAAAHRGRCARPRPTRARRRRARRDERVRRRPSPPAR